MSDIVSIELLLDPETEAQVRGEWDALASAGLSSLGAHTSPSNRPHVTLLVRSALPELTVGAALPIPVTLGAPVLFGGGDRRVLARSVIPSPELMSLHASVHAAAGDGDDAPHTAPGEWMPHVTLARRLKLTDLETALPLIGADIAGLGIALRRWDAATATVTEVY